MDNSIPKSVTNPKPEIPAVEGALPDLKKFEISFYMNGKNKIGSVVVEARSPEEAIELAGSSLKIDVRKHYG